MSVRRPSSAGSFYPASGAELSALVDRLIAAVEPSHSAPKALIVPHAGFVYSGPIAASGFARIAGRSV